MHAFSLLFPNSLAPILPYFNPYCLSSKLFEVMKQALDKILVHAPDRSSGERTQEVDIYLKFIGKFDVPLPEPTPEELAEMEKIRQRRAKGREKWRRAQERKKQQEQESA